MEKEIDTSANVLVYDSVTQVWMSQKALDELIAERKKKAEENTDGK